MPASPHAVTTALANQTLAACLRQWLPGQSWRQVRRLIAARRVLVNQVVCLDDARRLNEGDAVVVEDVSLGTTATSEELEIVYRDSHLVVVNKPPGIVSERHRAELHWPPHRKRKQPTLQELLQLAISQSKEKSSDKKSRPASRVRPVHRIDRDTSGLLVYALDAETEQRLIQQFRQHLPRRSYLAVAAGEVEAATFVSQLVRDRGDGIRGSALTIAPGGRGKRAVTHVTPLEVIGRERRYTVLRCQLETGRTHQIRIHLAELGHPVCGDKVYRGPLGQPPIFDASGAPRHALHAAELGFTHPLRGKELSFEAPLPADITELLERLKAE